MSDAMNPSGQEWPLWEVFVRSRAGAGFRDAGGDRARDDDQ